MTRPTCEACTQSRPVDERDGWRFEGAPIGTESTVVICELLDVCMRKWASCKHFKGDNHATDL